MISLTKMETVPNACLSITCQSHKESVFSVTLVAPAMITKITAYHVPPPSSSDKEDVKSLDVYLTSILDANNVNILLSLMKDLLVMFLTAHNMTTAIGAQAALKDLLSMKRRFAQSMILTAVLIMMLTLNALLASRDICLTAMESVNI